VKDIVWIRNADIQFKILKLKINLSHMSIYVCTQLLIINNMSNTKVYNKKTIN